MHNNTWDDLLRRGRDPARTPFDYIVVGSGAGGGPLAARLASAGRRVLLIEAGIDPAGPGDKPREVYAVPAYHAAATEDREISWQFSVRHYADDVRQRQDPKYCDSKDPSAKGGSGKGGIQYPRCAALGGCTAHHAMIISRPNDCDWDAIAQRTGDESWRSENMQGYFAKIERCSYYSVYGDFLGSILGRVLRLVQWIATLLNPMRELDPGGHGFSGWQPTSFVDPLFVSKIARSDPAFRGVLMGAMLSVLGKQGLWALIGRILSPLRLIRFLDPNVRSMDCAARDRLSLISLGTQEGRRFGLRERLLEAAADPAGNLVIASETHVTRVLFEAADQGRAPRAVGVEVRLGAHLYGASDIRADAAAAESMQFFAKGEIILSGGAFNTPQLLMLSGIGEREELAQHGIRGPCDVKGNPVAPVVHLAGVGKNLQDRYEVSVVSEAAEKFSTLDGVSLTPDDQKDPARQQWLRDGTGLYATNGGALAIMYRSENWKRPEPNVFIFGVPAAFRGYYWRWSRQLFHRVKGDEGDEQHNLWTWVILQAYTKNNAGTVRLLSVDPFVPPEINFHSFSEGPDGYKDDIATLCDALTRVRALNSEIQFKNEIQPGSDIQDTMLERWVQNEAWGHHACGTCRIGADPWREDPRALDDAGAVVDSRFRVHGVRGLRVVDASVFPEIPGYFIAASVFMMGEKAADTLLADLPEYPHALRDAEAAAIHKRREVAAVPVGGAAELSRRLPEDSIGLALSGGGVRSATFALGVLQALASRKQLRYVDFLSSVSGGGYIAAFLGRLFTRIGDDVKHKVDRVEDILTRLSSPELWWLRRNANYLAGAGRTDLISSVAVVTRNLVSLYFCVGLLLVALFGALRWADEAWLSRQVAAWSVAGMPVSDWWCAPAALLVLAVLPLGFTFWLAPPADGRKPYAAAPILLWCVLLACAIAALGFPGAAVFGAAAIAVLLGTWVWQEIARRRLEQTSAPNAGLLVRNRLTRWLGKSILTAFALAGAVVLDTLARYAAAQLMAHVAWGMLITGVLLPFIRIAAVVAADAIAKERAGGSRYGKLLDALGLLSLLLLVLLVFFVDVIAHGAFDLRHEIGVWLTVSGLAVSVVLGRASRFPNLSSLQPFYTERLVRTFLGASNDARVHPSGTNAPLRVDVSSGADDLPFDEYHPERNGGPLHLVGACVNETVDLLSGRELGQDYGLPFCIGPAGTSIGRRFHALWTDGKGASVGIQPLPVAPDPNAFHVLARSDGVLTRVGKLWRELCKLWTDSKDASFGIRAQKLRRGLAAHLAKNEDPLKAIRVERLRLGQWMAISGAAFTTGSGRGTSLLRSILFGLLNIRLGYWWNSGIDAGARPGRFPPGLWRRITALPATIFGAQATLLNELRGYFAGPSARFWYLSDGGHFDDSGMYELLRRRLPFIIAVDASEDPDYELEDLALLTRQVRLDFGAEFLWLDPAAVRLEVPDWIQRHIDPDAICALSALGRNAAKCAALARVSYANDPAAASWVLLIKPTVQPGGPVDVGHYATTHPAFPNESTFNQFFGDGQWETYRMLGWRAGRSVFTNLH